MSNTSEIRVLPAEERAELKRLAAQVKDGFASGNWDVDQQLGAVCQVLRGWVLLTANPNLSRERRDMLLDYVGAIPPDLTLGTLAYVEQTEARVRELEARISSLQGELAEQEREKLSLVQENQRLIEETHRWSAAEKRDKQAHQAELDELKRHLAWYADVLEVTQDYMGRDAQYNVAEGMQLRGIPDTYAPAAGLSPSSQDPAGAGAAGRFFLNGDPSINPFGPC